MFWELSKLVLCRHLLSYIDVLLLSRAKCASNSTLFVPLLVGGCRLLYLIVAVLGDFRMCTQQHAWVFANAIPKQMLASPFRLIDVLTMPAATAIRVLSLVIDVTDGSSDYQARKQRNVGSQQASSQSPNMAVITHQVRELFVCQWWIIYHIWNGGAAI